MTDDRHAPVPHRTLHLLPTARWEEWRAAPRDSRYAPATFAEEGFIHCTDGAEEMVEVANRYYLGERGAFVILVVDLGSLDVPWRYDDSAGHYPHVYGTLPRHAIRAVAAMERSADGRFLAVGPLAPA
jgi:uncharacterized protein (DUF952 family)